MNDRRPAASALYVGQVAHARLRPFRHGFRYRLFTLLLDLEELPGLAARSRLLRFNRGGLVSFQERDHGPRDGSPLRPWIEAQLARAGIDLEGGAVRLLCLPRILGYVFNPLTIWFCHHRDGRLLAVLHEVHNTFGEAHAYLLPLREPAGPGEAFSQACDKGFHVSPFIGMTARYRFRLAVPDARLAVAIRQEGTEGPQLIATLTGRRRPLSDRVLARQLLRFPLLTMQVIAAIHWQALRLWLKGARYHRRPDPPRHAVTLVEQGRSEPPRHGQSGPDPKRLDPGRLEAAE